MNAKISPKEVERSKRRNTTVKSSQKEMPAAIPVRQPIPFFSLNAWPLWLALLITAIDRLWLLNVFGFRYVGNDDSLFWLGAKDYAHGIFHEPCLYGQSYNMMIESFFAAPFLKMGMAPQIILPLVTAIMALTPFFVFARRELRKGNLAGAVIIAAMPLLLPVEYGMLTSMTRGFVTGVFFLSFWPLAERIRADRFRFILFGVVGGAALLANANSLIVLVALVVPEFVKERKNFRFYLFAALGALPFYLAHLGIAHYYKTHHDGVLHEITEEMLTFSTDHWSLAISSLADFFRWLFPFWDDGGAMGLLVVGGIGIYLFTQKKPVEGWALLAALFVIIISLGFPKIHDGGKNVLMPFSRMFIALPLLLGLALAQLVEIAGIPFRAVMIGSAVLVVVLTQKLIVTGDEVRAALASEEISPVEVRPVDELQRETSYIAQVAKEQGADILVALGAPYKYHDLQLWCHTGEVWNKDFPQTLVPQYERRWWRYLDETKHVHPTILFIGGGENRWKVLLASHPEIRPCGDGKLMLHVLRNNTLPTIDLLQKLASEAETKPMPVQ